MVDDLGGLEDAIEAAAKMAGLPPKPRVVYPRRRFSLRELLRNEWPMGAVSRVLPALETLRTPLYLMP
jgi:protease-4